MKLKKGDKVYFIGDASWGLLPMVVQSIDGPGYVCRHPEKGLHWFWSNELIKANKGRTEKLKKLLSIEAEASSLKKKLFPKIKSWVRISK